MAEMRNKDYGEEQTDKLLEELEEKIKKIYTQAYKELLEKFNKNMEKYFEKDKIMSEKYKSGKISEKDYRKWREGQAFQRNRIAQLSQELAKDLTNANQIAMSIANGYMPDAYATNFNYTTYDVEQKTKLNTSFTLYSRESVERLIRDDSLLLPKRKVDVPKDQAWNMKHVRNEIVQGILQGKSIPEISKSLRNVADMNRKASIRNARTMMTGAQNGGRLDAMERANGLGIEIQKEWMATLDNRTRDSHQKLDGERADFKKPFSNKLMFPGDPKGSPEEVYNCRCTMVPFYPEYANIIDSRITYKEWAKMHTIADENKPVKEISWLDKIKEISQRTSLDHEDVMEAGRIVSEQVHSQYLDDLMNEKKKTEADLAETNKRVGKIQDEMGKLSEDKKFQVSEDIHNYHLWRQREDYSAYSDFDISGFFKSVEEAEAYYEKTTKMLDDLNRKLQKEVDLYEELFKKKTNLFNQDQMANRLKGLLGNIREMGAEGFNIVSHLNNSKSPVRKSVEWAYDKYPKDWIKKSIDRSKLSVKKVNRGFYSDWRNLIAISGIGGDRSNETAVHELGHRFERSVQKIIEEERIFYKERTDGEELVWLGSGYSRDEKTRRDKFIHKYMGKDYGGQAFELVSMGFEYAYCDPLFLATDKNMEEWIYGLLAIVK